MSTTAADRPWLRFYGDVPASLSYPEITLYEALAVSARRTPEVALVAQRQYVDSLTVTVVTDAEEQRWPRTPTTT